MILLVDSISACQKQHPYNMSYDNLSVISNGHIVKLFLVWELLAALNDDTPRNYRHLSMIISLPTGVVSKECTAICVTFKN